MNTSKQVNAMLGLLFVFLVATLLYFLWDTARADQAAERQLMVNAERGGELFALNCRSCHGLAGLGPAEQGGLPGAPLNLPQLRVATPDNPEGLSPGELAARQLRFRDTIKCGRAGTLMPQWSQEQGGPLNDFQIEQLVLLITSAAAEDGWHAAIEAANHQDEFEPAKHLEEAATPDDRVLVLDDVSGLSLEMLLRLDEDPTDGEYELIIVTAISRDRNEIAVQRGAEGTRAMEHGAGTEVFNGPILPPTGPLTGEGQTPPCGQVFRQPEAPPEAEPVDVSGTIDVAMGDNFFEFEGQRNPTFRVAAGETITINLSNGGAAIHNMRVAGTDNAFMTDDDFVSDPDVVPAGAQATISFALDTPGTYDYQCDFHVADMRGQIVVQ